MIEFLSYWFYQPAFLILLIWVLYLSFLLVKSLSICFFFSKIQLCASLVFSISGLFVLVFISSLISTISFLLLTLGLVCSLLIPSDGQLGWLFEMFSCLLGRPVSLQTSLFKLPSSASTQTFESSSFIFIFLEVFSEFLFSEFLFLH